MVVVGSGPNGLMAGAVLARAGRRVLVVEAASTPGGGTRSSALIRPDVVHDVCSAIHPLALASPAFRRFADDGSLAAHGLDWVHPVVPVAHPLDGGRVAVLERSVDDTASGLGGDGAAYRRLMQPFVEARRCDCRRRTRSISLDSDGVASDRRGASLARASTATRRGRCSPASPRTPCCRCARRRPPRTG